MSSCIPMGSSDLNCIRLLFGALIKTQLGAINPFTDDRVVECESSSSICNFHLGAQP